LSTTSERPLTAPDTQVIPRIISVDDHVLEPDHVWQQWLPEAYRARGPRVERRMVDNLHIGPNGFACDIDPPEGGGVPADVWFYEDKISPHLRPAASAGLPPEENSLRPITYDDMRPGCYEPKARIEDMDAGHIDKSMCFPSFPRFCGQGFLEASDHDLAWQCVRAYNRWMLEEWCGDSGGRLIPLIIVPLWDAQLAGEEVRWAAAQGCRAVCFSEIPPRLGLPSIHSGAWDPFFAACNETGTVICMHIGSSSRVPVTSPDAPSQVTTTMTFQNSSLGLADWLFSGKLAQYPQLRIAFSEGQIGWVPYVLERADDVWRQHRGWQGHSLPEPPSSYYYRSVYTCFFRDRVGVRLLDLVGEDNATFESDYPHTDSTWPNSKSVAEECLAGLPAEVFWKVVRGNALRMLSIDPDVDDRPYLGGASLTVADA
jgi:predicted TIM-barrel fold metal-dependent hydrolase